MILGVLVTGAVTNAPLQFLITFFFWVKFVYCTFMHQFLLPLGKWVAASDFPTPGESRYYEKQEGFFYTETKTALECEQPWYHPGVM
jgi:hypothetical protein